MGSRVDRDPVRHWVLVTGASSDLDNREKEAALQIGAMLAREGYGLVVGDWPGVDRLVATAFLEGLEPEKHPARIRHVANFREGKPLRVADAVVLPDTGEGLYSSAAVSEAHAGIVVSGREGSKPAMDALLRLKKPVLPVAFLGRDGFAIFQEILSGWQERPVQGLTERQFLELVRPWRYDTRTIARLLRASLATEPDIFISYRREDVPAAAGRIFDELSHSYGERSVFIDYANVLVGQEIERILDRLRDCKVLIAIVGPGWDVDRLADPDDYVRREIETAAAAGLKVIPLLVSRSSLPPRAELPPGLGFLWDLNFAKLHTEDWTGGVRKLEAAVDEALFAGADA